MRSTTSRVSSAQAGMGEAPRAAISTVCLSGTLEDKIHAASECGFTGIEILESDLVMSAWSPRRVGEEAAASGLAVVSYQPFHIEALPPAQFAAALRRVTGKVKLVQELGTGVLVACASKSSAGLDDDDLAAEQLTALATRAADHGVRIAYEAVPWGRVRTFDHAWRIVERADHPAAGLCLDSFHVLSPANDLSGMERLPGDRVFHVQLADAPRLDMDNREWSLHGRLFPGQGTLDNAGFLRTLRAAGYDGPVALEVFNDVYQQEDPRHTATDAMRSVLALEEQIAINDGPAGGASAVVVDLPRAPELAGFAFAEIAVDDVSGPLLARTLTGLGFARTGRHRSKPVELWQQGGARLLLNWAPQRSVSPATAAVCAVAVRSSDLAHSARRAERLMAPRLPRVRASDEADLTGVAAPDGTVLTFCGAEGGGAWLDDFVPTDDPPPPTTLVRDIDHVGLGAGLGDFEQATLFYRSVLGLRPGRTVEVTAPFGLIRRWSTRDGSHRLRMTVHTAPLRRGDWAPGVTSPQHIAFVTDDAVACAEAVRKLGAPVLEIPGNYFDDLETRVDLPAGLLASMRENSILHDRDDDGEFLHFYTEISGSRVFFEVVQRIGGYDGVGAPSTIPLRSSAHRRQRLRVLTAVPYKSEPTPRHDYSLAHLTALSLSPPELVEAAAAAGYRYVGLRMTKVTMEEPHYPLASDPALMRATKTHLAATGIEVLDIELARITSGDNPRDFLRFLEAGAELGARHVIAQLPDADFSRKTARFAELCELARPLNLTVDLEFPSWTETPDLAEATRVLRAADQPNAGMLVDLLHFARSGSSLAELEKLPRSWFNFAHVCDAPAEVPMSTKELIHTARFERLFPGEGGIDTHGILAALPSGIPYALEIPRAMLIAQVGAKEHARLAITAARRELDARAEDRSPTEPDQHAAG